MRLLHARQLLRARSHVQRSLYFFSLWKIKVLISKFSQSRYTRGKKGDKKNILLAFYKTAVVSITFISILGQLNIDHSLNNITLIKHWRFMCEAHLKMPRQKNKEFHHISNCFIDFNLNCTHGQACSRSANLSASSRNLQEKMRHCVWI